jgi:hypothetical protein
MMEMLAMTTLQDIQIQIGWAMNATIDRSQDLFSKSPEVPSLGV